jgi:lipopolysaccharide/colanic/teichoic acid biosynthesis glycosyltransferase
MTLDLEYVDRWTLSLDLALLLRTIPAIITGRGAR